MRPIHVPDHVKDSDDSLDSEIEGSKSTRKILGASDSYHVVKRNIIVAEDAIVNMEVLKSHLIQLNLDENAMYCYNGVDALEAATS